MGAAVNPDGGASPEAASGDTRPVEVAIVADDDQDSSIGEEDLDNELSVASLRSSILSYQMENGFGYHGLNKGTAAEYIMPTDEGEQNRLDLQNHHFLLTFEGKQYFAPGADTAKRVMDAGTGTGIWAIDFADAHPQAEVVGVDVAPIQPSFVPPNCRFEIDDLDKEWTWAFKWDYIFTRTMNAAFADWEVYCKKAFDNLEPGGWLEIIDAMYPISCDDGTLKPDSSLQQWNDLLIKGAEALGRPIIEPQHHKQRVLDAGFVNVEEKRYRWPTNRWPKDKNLKEVGLWTLANVEGNLEHVSMALLARGAGMSREEVLSFLAGVRKDLRDTKIHAYWSITVVYGQKPTTTSEGS